jgi:phosphonate transport system substrate-binding protein
MKKTLCLLLSLFCCGLAYAEDHVLSMLPTASVEADAALLAPLAARLSAETGTAVRPLASRSQAQYEADMLQGRIAVGYEDPGVYVSISSRHEAVAAVRPERNGGLLRGIVISRPGSGIAKAADLKGKRIMIVSRKSAGGYLSQKQTLKEEGVDAEQDCQIAEAAAGREENVIIAVSIGEADAGFISESGLHKADEYIAPGSVALIMTTAPLPTWVVSVRRDLPQALKEAVRSSLLRLNKDDPLVKALGIAGFQAAADGNYDSIRALSQ